LRREYVAAVSQRALQDRLPLRRGEHGFINGDDGRSYRIPPRRWTTPEP